MTEYLFSLLVQRLGQSHRLRQYLDALLRSQIRFYQQSNALGGAYVANFQPQALRAAVLRALPISTAMASQDDNNVDKVDSDGREQVEGPIQNMMADPGPAPTAASFQACDGDVGRAISVSRLGRITVTEITCPQ